MVSHFQITLLCLIACAAGLSVKFARIADDYPLYTFEAAGTVLGTGKDSSYLVVFGGFSGFPKVTTAVYQRKFGEQKAPWKKLASMPFKITHLAQWSNGNTFCGVGGYDGDFPGTSGKRGFCYNRLTNKYSLLPNLPADRAGGGLVLVKHKGKQIFVYAGGVDRVFPNFSTHVDYGTTWTLEFGNPTAKWKKVAQDMPNPRNHMAAVESCGRYYFVGGQKKVDEVAGNSVVVNEFLPGSLTWKTVAPLPIPLGHVSASVMAYKCGIIVVGGITNGKKLSDAVLYYNSKSNKWSRIGTYPNLVATPVCGIRGSQILCATGGEFKVQKNVFVGTINDLTGPPKEPGMKPKTPPSPPKKSPTTPKTPKTSPSPPKKSPTTSKTPKTSPSPPKKSPTTPKTPKKSPSPPKKIPTTSNPAPASTPTPAPAPAPAVVVKSKKPVAPTKNAQVKVIKMDETDYDGPLESLLVVVGGKVAYALKDNSEIAVKTFGQPVVFKADTGNENVGKLHFEVPDKPIQIKAGPNYSFSGKWVLNKKFPVIVTHFSSEDKTEFKAEVLLE